METVTTQTDSDSKALLVRDVMTKNPFTVTENDRIVVAGDIMEWKHIRHVPVVDSNDKLVGIITHRDLLRASISSIAGCDKLEERKIQFDIPVSEIMQKDVAGVAPGILLRTAAKLMLSNKFGCLPVVENEKLVGIITEADFVELVSDCA